MKKKAKKAAPKKTARKAAPKASKTPKKVQAIPAGYRTVTPLLVVRDGGAAIDFYKKALGAKELLRMPMPGGGIGHAELQIGDSRVMLADETPAMGSSAPQTVGGSPVHIFLYITNVDQAYTRATGAGATGTMPPQDMFWGDRYAKVTDPFGHNWSFATHIEDVTPKEMNRRAEEWAKSMAGNTP